MYNGYMSENVQKRIQIHGFFINYDEKDYAAIRYLRDDLQTPEVKVFFDQARARGKAPFEDNYEHKFLITYSGGIYTLSRP